MAFLGPSWGGLCRPRPFFRGRPGSSWGRLDGPRPLLVSCLDGLGERGPLRARNFPWFFESCWENLKICEESYEVSSKPKAWPGASKPDVPTP